MKHSKTIFEDGQEKDEVRLNKFLSDAGICSRRGADDLIAKGQVMVDGVPAVTGMKVSGKNRIVVSGKPVEQNRHLILIALNKPQGIVCTTDSSDPDNVIDFLNYGKRIFPIGRLDKDSEGLLLLTNDGDIVNKILRAGNNHEKEYLVTVNKLITPEFLQGMANGVPILETVTKPCTIEATGKNEFRIILTQGLNRQIRRMCEYFDYKVQSLKRVRIMNISLGRLKTGDFRNVTDRELEELKGLLEQSVSEPVSAAAAKPGVKAAPAKHTFSAKSKPGGRTAPTDKHPKTGNPVRTENERGRNQQNNRKSGAAPAKPDRTSKPGGKGVRAGKPRNYQ